MAAINRVVVNRRHQVHVPRSLLRDNIVWRHSRRPAVMDNHNEHHIGVFFLAVYGDPKHRAPIGSAGLAPKGCFIAAHAVEREVGQISETQTATRELT
jgi:hypothetical protein